MDVTWDVDLHVAFVPEFEGLPETVQDELLAHVAVLEQWTRRPTKKRKPRP